MVESALDDPVGQPPLRDKIRDLVKAKELPAGTRVVYPGVRKNAPSSPKEMRAMVERALDDPVGQPPLRDKIRDLVKAKGSNGCK